MYIKSQHLYMNDILNKIDRLRTERNWSIYKLAEEAGLTQSTVANMFARDTLPSIKTLEALCSALGISLSEFFAEDNSSNLEEAMIINAYNKLSQRDKRIIKSLLKAMLNNEK